jgi:hypothetical protein
MRQQPPNLRLLILLRKAQQLVVQMRIRMSMKRRSRLTALVEVTPDSREILEVREEQDPQIKMAVRKDLPATREMAVLLVSR